ncbi:MAG TPA: nicotinate phosphoribosyltransferase [Anaeromyxobacteraceae bacterium]
MAVPTELYRPSLALLTDFYEITMAAAAWKSGIAGEEAAFSLSFRKNPFQGGFTIAAGLEPVIEYVARYRFDDSDLAYLAAQEDGRGAPLFEQGFLDHLAGLRLEIDLDAVPEGTAVFPWEPVLRVKGPIIPCMLLETPLLTLVNFQTLIATKAARVCLAAGGAPVLEFGTRRAQGFDGALSASRAAYLGGCAATSNVLAGKLFGIPVKGTHAHAWVMLFDDEREAFRAYAAAMPGNCVLLVDTYDSLEGVEHAIETGRWLRANGGELSGIRLDSGDLAWLSQEARRRLDAAGFQETAILASNELDERIIESLREQGARIAVWGVGTRLVTGSDDGALGGVYKLGAVRKPGGAWVHRVKLSEQSGKTSVPGLLQVRRYRHDGRYLADCIYDELTGIPDRPVIVDPLDHTRRRELPADASGEDLLRPIFRAGALVYERPTLAACRQRTSDELALLHAGLKRFVNPHQYPAGLERNLFDLRTRLILEARGLPA